MKYAAFGGRVVFDVGHFTPLRGLEIDRLREQLKDAPHAQELKRWLDNYTHLMGITKSIEFHFVGGEQDILTDFKNFWEAVENNTPLDNWLTSVELASSITNEWFAAENQASRPFIDPVAAPLSALTEGQKVAALDPDNPLANNAPPTVKKS